MKIKLDVCSVSYMYLLSSGDLGVTHWVHLWLDGKRVVDFL